MNIPYKSLLFIILCISCKDKIQHYNHYNNKDTVNVYSTGTISVDTLVDLNSKYKRIYSDSISVYKNVGSGRIIYVGDTAVLGEYKIIYDTVYIHDTIVQRIGRGNRSRYFDTTDSIIVIGSNNSIIIEEK